MELIFFLKLVLLQFATRVVSSDPVADQIQWLRSKGGYVSDKITHGSYDKSNPSVKVLFANAPIQENEQIMIIPAAALITGGPNEEMCETARNLVKERHLGNASTHGPYVRYLFESFPHEHLPLAWSEETKDLFRTLVGKDLEPQDFADNSFENLCESIESDHDKEALRAAFRIVVSRGWEDKLVPVLDMINHRNGRFHNVDQANSVHGTQDISIVAIRDISVGEQLYYSYNECHDVDCEGIAYTYTTPQIFADYGFVEQYPRRFNFDDDLVFEIDMNDDGFLQLDWISDPASVQATDWLRGHLHRLHKLHSTISQGVENLRSHEKISILEYYQAMVTALEMATSWDLPIAEDDQQCALDQNNNEVCTAATVYSDSLEEVSDPLQYQISICSEFGVAGREISSDVVKSHYQTIEFNHYYDDETKKTDTCLYLGGWLQTCTSFRPHYHEWLVHYPASFLKEVKRVLFLGGGDNMILHEVLKYPTLELVVGMELDQQVVRSSFKNMGIQPHFDLDSVQWWFGDASKSLQMLPEHYYGTFDLVIVDLQTYVIESMLVTKELNIMDFAMLLLKPDGILSQNEDFVPRTNVDFAKYTVDLELNDVPVLCQQSINMGSNAVDFFRADRIDHGVETIVFNSTAADSLHAWWNYRQNDHRRSRSNMPLDKSSDEKQTPIADASKDSQGIILVLEVESATRSSSLHTLSDIHALITETLEKAGLTILSSSSFQSESMFILLQEGYVVLRPWTDYEYYAFDLCLWSSFDKLDSAKPGLVAALGGKSSSSFRIVTGGMIANSVGLPKFPVHDKVQSDNLEMKGSMPVGTKHLDTLLKEMSKLIHTPTDPVIAVICAKELDSCKSLDILRNIDDPRPMKLIPIKTCASEESSQRDIDCENEIINTLELHGKISGIIIDPLVSLKMGQVLHKIFSSSNNREKFLNKHYVMLAPTMDSSDSWRKALMERFRTDIVKSSPSFHADISFMNTVEDTSGLNIFSKGDRNFYSHLANATKTFERKADLSAKINFVRDGLLNYIEDFQPTKVVADSDYDSNYAREQWKTQHPLGLQSIFQFESKSPQSPLPLGTRVLAKFEGSSVFTGKWYKGMVVKKNDNDTYNIDFDDGDEMKWVQRSSIRKWKKNREISVSDRVLIKYDGDEWCQGTVLEKLPNRDYKVHLHDGLGTLSIVKKIHLIRQNEELDASDVIFPVSPALLKDAMQNAIAAIHNDRSMGEVKVDVYDGIGDGYIVTAFWTQGSAIITWDGRKKLVMNLATYGSKNEKHQLFRNVFAERTSLPFILVSHNQHPRGFGRVVNFKHELKSLPPVFLKQ